MLFIFSFYFLFLNFLKSNTVFFKILFMFLIVVNCCLLVSFCGADFFAGFLVAAELPIILISLLFYFHKYSLQVDHIFSLNVTFYKSGVYFLFFLFLGFFFENLAYQSLICNPLNGNIFDFFYNLGTTANNNANCFYFYDLILSQSFFTSARNDFYLYFSVYYNINYPLVLLFGVFLFLVSCICIFVFFAFKWLAKVGDCRKQTMLFLRKQSMLRQGLFLSKLKFFKKK